MHFSFFLFPNTKPKILSNKMSTFSLLPFQFPIDFQSVIYKKKIMRFLKDTLYIWFKLEDEINISYWKRKKKENILSPTFYKSGGWFKRIYYHLDKN